MKKLVVGLGRAVADILSGEWKIIRKHWKLLMTLAVLLIVAIGLVNFVNCYHELFEKLAFAQYAHVRAGKPIPFDAQYTQDDTSYPWGMENNSLWISNWVNMIVPVLVHEKISIDYGNYPYTAAFVPMPGNMSFNVAGQAVLMYGAVLLNDRFAIDPTWMDERSALSTLVHELIHLQSGAYIGYDPEVFEPNTQAATLEALAGMCNQGLELACRSFWYEVEGYARVELSQEFKDHGLSWWYQRLADLLWRDDAGERGARKSIRYWSDNKEEQEYIVRAYYQTPWQYVVTGVLENSCFDTKLYTLKEDGIYMVGYVNCFYFDDTKDLLGPFWLKVLRAYNK